MYVLIVLTFAWLSFALQPLVDLSQYDVIISLGDSITAGFGELGLEYGLTETRGLSAFAGGDDLAITLPNIINQNGGKLTGMSIGKHLVEICYGELCPSFSQHRESDDNNMAYSGSLASNLMKQVEELKFKQINTNKKILGTLFIGANDVCLKCRNANQNETDFGNYIREVIQQLDQMYPNLTLVVYKLFRVSEIAELSSKLFSCKALHVVTFIECDCAFQWFDHADEHRQDMDVLTSEYNNQISEIKIPNLVVDSLFENVDITKFPITAISTIDCFHPSLQAHERLAINMYNSLLWKIQEKEGNYIFNWDSVTIEATE
jgi:phospholipase B1, membrane-associated